MTSSNEAVGWGQRVSDRLPAFRHRNFRLFFFGQGISLIGFWMQMVGLSWLVYRLTDSALMLGLVGFAGQIPSFLIAPFGGVFADRCDRRDLVLITQILALPLALVLAGLTLWGRITIMHVFVLNAAFGLLTAFYMPVRQAFVTELVEDKKDLPNAIAVSSFLLNGARLFGPALAGVVIATAGEGICFLANALSYVPIIIALVMMRIPPHERTVNEQSVLSALKEGFDYARRSRNVRGILFLMASVGLFGTASSVLMPVFAKDILDGGPEMLGFLTTMAGLGAMVATFFLAFKSNGKFKRRVRVIAAATGLLGGSIIVFGLSRSAVLSGAVLLIQGFGGMVQMFLANATLLTIVPDEKRGRVMSFYTMSFLGMLPFGNLLAGSLGSKIGAPGAVLFSGSVCVLCAVLFSGVFSHRGRTRRSRP